mgnify:CR=1 FL=1
MGPEPMIQASKKKEAFLCDVILHHQKNAISEMPAEP